ncbi:phosphoribosylamine--glycine ligase, partial [Streptomyces sp. TRM76130]|nr:phosphoribosylamine--glycine ligase [Streptomyces sp. TRM76130]
MGSEQIRRWESGALAHAVTDPFGQGPVPWLRGGESYCGDGGRIVPWYVDQDRAREPDGDGTRPRGAPRKAPHRSAGGPRAADDVHQQ